MGQWRFDSVAHLGEPLVSKHDGLLITAAVLISILAASVLIPAVERFRASTSLKSHLFWTVTGSFAMALGVWGVHFCSILALQLPVPMSFNPSLAALSIVPALMGAAITIGVCKAPVHPPVRVYIAAVSMALGFGTMQYASMEAIIAPMHIRYDLGLFVFSFVIATVLIWIGLHSNIYLVLRTHNHWSARILGSVILGICVSATNYFSVLATSFFADPQFNTPINNIDARSITLGIVIVVSTLVGLLLVAIFMDRRISGMSRSLNASESRFRSLAETSACAIFTFTETFTYANPALSDITGYSEAQLRDMPVEHLFGRGLYTKLQEARQERQGKQVIEMAQEVKVECRDGDFRWLYLTVGTIEQTADRHFVGSAFDITERKQMEQRLRHLAFYDSLTDLPNRVFFIGNLQKRLQARGADALTDVDSCALLTINLGRLKWINDSFGQAAGDDLLRNVAHSLRQLTKGGDLLARVGGHEFAILLHSAASLDAAIDLAQTILQKFARPYCVSDQEIQLRCQIGIASASAATRDAEDVVHQAYIAMNQARGQNRNSFCVFDKEMRESVQRRLQLESDLSRALTENQFELYYQPIVSLPLGSDIEGFEALIRWPRADGSFTSPAEFIPVAEETGLIGPLGDWILETACRQLAHWNQQLHATVYVSVNISSLQLFQPNFVNKLTALVEQHRIAPGQLKLELTESVLVEDGQNVLRTMQKVLALGCHIMIDDFGTGYSSLSYLSRFPASVIKIDQSFIQSIGANDVGAPIIKAIVSMARDLNLSVVAEGVENEHAARLLKTIGCESAQGFLFSRPLPAADATALLPKPARTTHQVARASLRK